MRRRPITLLRFLLLATTVAALGLLAWWLRPAPPRLQLFPDGTEVLMVAGSTIVPAAGFPHPRVLLADGEFYLTVREAGAPMTVRTRLLALTIPSAAVLRLTARAKEAGEQVEVVSGAVIAHKNYPSRESQPDQLGAGEMSMVNKSIDLMEKETFAVAEAEAWGRQLREHAERHTQ